MERKAITLTLNLDEMTILGASLVRLVREARGTKTLETMYPNADLGYMLEQVAAARNEVEE